MSSGAETLARERRSASFNPERLTELLHGGAAEVAARRAIVAELCADPLLGAGRLDDHFLSRADAFKMSLARMRRLFELRARRSSAMASHPEALESLRLHREGGALEKAGGFGLHWGMFMPTIDLMGTDAQRAKWLPLARSCAIVGTYAQTELGHGTNLSALETTATYDGAAQEFVLETPTVTATKWWPGGLGKTTTHAVVMARLLLHGVDRGQHAFVVQLRDLGTHAALPGIELGDIGPKMGYDRTDNGYLVLRGVRVPRENLLARHKAVAADGSYSTAGHAKAVYGTMLIVRVYLVEEASRVLQHATTIAARYSAVRRQGGSGGEERQVLDYATQRARLLPLVAAAYAFHFASDVVRDDYDAYRAAGDASRLPALHAMTSGLKAACTSYAAAGVETCRLLCGGHGYSLASGLPSLFAEFAPSQTYEGDNVVMLLQAARWVVKQVRDGAGYLGQPTPPPPPSSADALATDGAAQLVAVREGARVLAQRAAAALAARIADGAPPEVAWSEGAAVELAAAARAHARASVCAMFAARLGELRRGGAVDGASLSALEQLCELHTLSTLEEVALAPLLESGWLTGADAAAARGRVASLLTPLRRDAIALVDAFDLSDWELNSVLGRSDGDVYAQMLAWARRSPLNATEVVGGFEEHVRPLMGKVSLDRLPSDVRPRTRL